MNQKRMACAVVTVVVALAALAFVGAKPQFDTPAITKHHSTQLISTPEGLHAINDGYPAQALDTRGRQWLFWASTRLKDPNRVGLTENYVRGDKILARHRQGSQWADSVILSTSHGINWEPTAVATPDGRTWVFWSTRRNGNHDVVGRSINPDLSLGPEFYLTEDLAIDASPRAAVDPDGNIWVAWESLRDGHYQTYCRVHRPGQQGQWSQPERISTNDDHNYRPSLAVLPSGSLAVAWDSAVSGRYAVYLRQHHNGIWSPVQRAPHDSSLDVYAPSVAADSSGNLWVACAQNVAPEPLWGLRGVRDDANPRPRILLSVLKDNQWLYPNPLGGNPAGLLTADGDMPLLFAGADGRVWAFWQKLKSHLNFRIMATYYQEDRWADVVELGANEPLPEASWLVLGGRSINGRIDNHPSVLQLSDGTLQLAYERDRGWFTNRDIFIRTLKAASQQATEPVLTSGSSPTAPQFSERVYSTQPGSSFVRTPVEAGGRTYNVYYGDLHGHLLMDDGHVGSPDQYYTFARDRRGIDFVALTPHTEAHKFLISEITWVQRMAKAFNQPGRFVAFSGFEWSQGDYKLPREGHKHLIFESDDHPTVISVDGDADTVTELNRFLHTTDGIMFAHHLPRAISGGTRWDVIDTRVEPDSEIVSHWGRGEYYGNPGHTVMEVHGASLQDGWATGLQLGVVGGSDNHDLYSERETALTVVFAPSLNRRDILDALRERRCYATSGEPIYLDFQINGHLMGSKITAHRAPSLQVHVIGTAPLEKIEIVKHVEGGPYPFPVVASVFPKTKEYRLTWNDEQFDADAMYYVRVTQPKDPAISEVKRLGSASAKLASSFPNEMAWSSPIWVRKP